MVWSSANEPAPQRSGTTEDEVKTRISHDVTSRANVQRCGNRVERVIRHVIREVLEIRCDPRRRGS